MNPLAGFKFVQTAKTPAEIEREEKEARRVKMLAWMRQDLANRHFLRDMKPRKPPTAIAVLP